MIRKWIAVNEDKKWYRPVQGPFFGSRLVFFLQDVDKNNVPPDPPWYGTSWQVFLELTFSDVGRPVVAAGWKEVLRAPAAHGVSSNYY